MKNITQSFHIGTGKHSIENMKDIKKIMQHNERLYKGDRKDLVYNFFDGSLSENLQREYKKIFQEYVDEYNLKQKRDDRKIDNYLDYVSKDKRQSIAVEMILQYGDKEFWQSHPKWKTADKAEIIDFFEGQLLCLEETSSKFVKNIPGAKLHIVQASLHFDEASPHLHIVAIPTMPSKRHVKLQPQKSSFFTKERLKGIHDYLRVNALNFFYTKYNTSLIKGEDDDRKYIEIPEYKQIQELKKDVRKQRNKLKQIESEIDKKQNEVLQLDLSIKNYKDDVNILQSKKNLLQEQIDGLENKIKPIEHIAKVNIDDLDIKKQRFLTAEKESEKNIFIEKNKDDDTIRVLDTEILPSKTLGVLGKEGYFIPKDLMLELHKKDNGRFENLNKANKELMAQANTLTALNKIIYTNQYRDYEVELKLSQERAIKADKEKNVALTEKAESELFFKQRVKNYKEQLSVYEKENSKFENINKVQEEVINNLKYFCEPWQLERLYEELNDSRKRQAFDEDENKAYKKVMEDIDFQKESAEYTSKWEKDGKDLFMGMEL